MNRFTKYNLSKWERYYTENPDSFSAASLVARLLTIPDVQEKYQKLLKAYPNFNDLPPIIDLLAYVARTQIKCDGENTLADLRDKQGPYDLAEGEYFTGRFEYHRDIGGFVPLFESRTIQKYAAL